MKKLFMIVLCLAVAGVIGCSKGSQEVSAGEYSSSCEGYKGKLLNRCVGHPDNSREDPAGVGADVLIHETEHLDLVAEYKYDVNNEEHSIFGVFKTKKSIVEYVKALFNRD